MYKSYNIFINCCFKLLSQNHCKHEENLKKLDEVYGPCDNPHRQLTKNQKQVCKDKQRAAGQMVSRRAISLTGLLSGMDGNNNKIVYQSKLIKSYGMHQ